MKAKGQTKRATVGFIVDWLDGPYQQSILDGIISKAEERDVNLLVFEGGGIGSAKTYETHNNLIYRFASSPLVDGLIILTGSLCHHAGQKETEKFCQQFLPMPVFSISYELDGIPSLFTDNRKGIRDLVLHLARFHGLKKIAFIGGPENNHDAGERYSTYVDALKEAGIELDDALVVNGDFMAESGASAAYTLVNERKVQFDALMAANDDMALGAIQALREMGKRVPADIAITGFDNTDASKYSSPPLTTVSQSFRKQGECSVELLLDLIEGKGLPNKTVFSPQLIVRESCGCFSDEVMEVAAAHPALRPAPDGAENAKAGSRLAQAIITRLGMSDGDSGAKKKIGELIERFEGYLAAGTIDTSMMLAWSGLMDGIRWPGGLFTSANRLVSELRTESYRQGLISTEAMRQKAEVFFQQARILTAERAKAEENRSVESYVHEFWVLHTVNEELIDVFDERRVLETLSWALPRLAIHSCFICRYEGTPDRARPIFVMQKDGVLPPESYAAEFPSLSIAADGFLPADRRFAFIVEALYHQNDIGYALFELKERKGRLYGELRRVISARLQGAMMFSQLQAQTDHLRAQTRQLSELRKVMGGMIETLSKTVEARDPYTAGHQRRVADLARTIGTEMGLPKEIIEGIRLASIVHDLGKIYVPSEILNKPGKLLPVEFNLIKIHPQVAYDILKTIDFPWPLADIVYQHHERLDGSGYPQGLTGEQMRLESKILAVADVVEAMASHRPYRPAVGVEEALKEIGRNKAVLYDSDVVDTCVKLFTEKGYSFK